MAQSVVVFMHSVAARMGGWQSAMAGRAAPSSSGANRRVTCAPVSTMSTWG